ncbi:MAG: hypothetical protein CMF38_02225 [Legionellaceae bacterium]|nr:hypothetical protein [Legionellaceae bacterium]HCA89388.1 hypothetical protein [Legionellales bacterium]|tara:strand:+ start:3342 stop:3944 length:603 start_codon:yes stop_codon:yes gene_type:complete
MFLIDYFSSITTTQSALFHAFLTNVQARHVAMGALPYPYDVLLTQPLMTQNLEDFYQSTCEMKVLKTHFDKNQRLYARAITLNVAQNALRVQSLHPKKACTVQVAFIVMNVEQLSAQAWQDVMAENKPFGVILRDSGLKTISQNCLFYALIPTHSLSKLLQCSADKILYARAHTLVRQDNQQWLAQVVEILSGHLSRYHS